MMRHEYVYGNAMHYEYIMLILYLLAY